MAKPRDADFSAMVIAAADRADELRGTIVLERDGRPMSPAERRFRESEGQAVEALALRMAGVPCRQIAERLGLGEDEVSTMIEVRLGRATARRAESMRALENERLDRLQTAVWTEALKGSTVAVHAVLEIIAARRRMNGLDEPKKISLSVNVRAEMQQALSELRQVVLSEVIDEVAGDDDDADGTDRDDDDRD